MMMIDADEVMDDDEDEWCGVAEMMAGRLGLGWGGRQFIPTTLES
jgi:hypothetical protein